MASPSEVYIQAEQKGRQLLSLLNERLQNAGTHDVERQDTATYYETSFENGSIDLDVLVENALLDNDLVVEDWALTSISSRAPDAQTAYLNYMSAKQGAIVCVDDHKNRDQNEPIRRVEWSQLMAQTYQETATVADYVPSSLKTVWRCYVTNPDTRRVLGEAETFGSPAIPGPLYTEYVAGDTAVFALLGYPNGKGVAGLLIDNFDMFGRKSVKSVRVLHDQAAIKRPPVMYFMLTVSVIAGEKAKNKRSAGSLGRRAKRQEKQFQNQSSSQDDPKSSQVQ